MKSEGHSNQWEPVRHEDQVLYDPAHVVGAMGAEVQVQYPQTFIHDAPDLPDSAAFTHLFAGLVQLADWLDSDTHLFPYTRPRDNPRAAELCGLSVKILSP